jgi:hypothetical protein
MTARAGDFDVNVWTANAAIPPAMARTMAIVMVRMGFSPFFNSWFDGIVI